MKALIKKEELKRFNMAHTTDCVFDKDGNIISFYIDDSELGIFKVSKILSKINPNYGDFCVEFIYKK